MAVVRGMRKVIVIVMNPQRIYPFRQFFSALRSVLVSFSSLSWLYGLRALMFWLQLAAVFKEKAIINPL